MELEHRIAELIGEIQRRDLDPGSKNMCLVELGNHLFAPSLVWGASLTAACRAALVFHQQAEPDVRLWLANNSHLLLDRCFTSRTLNAELPVLLDFMCRSLETLLHLMFDPMAEIARASIASATVVHSTCWKFLCRELRIQHDGVLTSQVEGADGVRLWRAMCHLKNGMYSILALHHQRGGRRTPAATIPQLQAIKFCESVILDRVESLAQFTAGARSPTFSFVALPELMHDSTTLLGEVERFLLPAVPVAPAAFQHSCSLTLVSISLLARVLCACNNRPAASTLHSHVIDHLDALSKQTTLCLLRLNQTLIPPSATNEPSLLWGSPALTASITFAFKRAFIQFFKYPSFTRRVLLLLLLLLLLSLSARSLTHHVCLFLIWPSLECTLTPLGGDLLEGVFSCMTSMGAKEQAEACMQRFRPNERLRKRPRSGSSSQPPSKRAREAEPAAAPAVPELQPSAYLMMMMSSGAGSTPPAPTGAPAAPAAGAAPYGPPVPAPYHPMPGPVPAAPAAPIVTGDTSAFTNLLSACGAMYHPVIPTNPMDRRRLEYAIDMIIANLARLVTPPPSQAAIPAASAVRDPRLARATAAAGTKPDPMDVNDSYAAAAAMQNHHQHQLPQQQQYHTLPAAQVAQQNAHHLQQHPSAPAPAPQAPTRFQLPRELVNELHEAAIVRIIESEQGVRRAGRQSLRLALLPRLLQNWSIDSLVAARMFDHLFEDYEARQELALQWLYQEFQAIIDARLDKKKRAHDDKSTVALWLRYNALLARLLQTLQAAMEKEPEQLEPLFVETMLQAPFLPALDFDPDYEEPMALSLTDRPAPRVIEPPGADVAHLLASMCERIDSQRLLSLGFLLLKKLIRHRTASQQTALEMLLQYASHSESAIRSVAIQSAVGLSSNSVHASVIENHARRLLVALSVGSQVRAEPSATEAAPEVNGTKASTADLVKVKHERIEGGSDSTNGTGQPQPSDGSAPEELTAEECVRQLQLFLELCIRKHDLLVPLMDAYVRVATPAKSVILQSLALLVKRIGPHAPVFVHLCSSIAPGAENFVLQLLQSITEEARPSAQLIAAVKQYHSSTNDDPRFLVPILSGFTKDEILAMLPKLVLLPRPKSWIERVLGTAPETSPIIPPAELLTHLHLIDCGTQKERVIKVMEATQCCLEMPNIFHNEVMAVVFQQLVPKTPTPPLLLRTVLQTLKRFPELREFVVSGVLSRLLPRSIWQDRQLWKGFGKCCEAIVPHSFPLLLTVAPQPLEDLLTLVPELRKPLREYVHALPDEDRVSIVRGTLAVIEKL